jgi:hypothetical protein
MPTNVCSCCHRPLPTPRRAAAVLLEDATDAQRFTFYKRTAPVEDLKFTRRDASPALQGEIDALLAGAPSAKDAARMRERRRVELAEAERAADVPALGSARWQIAEGLRPAAPDPAVELPDGYCAIVTTVDEVEVAS